MATNDGNKLPPDVGEPRPNSPADVGYRQGDERGRPIDEPVARLDPGQLATPGVVGAILDAIRRAARPDELPRNVRLGVSDRVCAALLELGGVERSTIFSRPDDCYVIDAVTLRVGSIDVECQRKHRAPRDDEAAALAGPGAGEHLESYRFARIGDDG